MMHCASSMTHSASLCDHNVGSPLYRGRLQSKTRSLLNFFSLRHTFFCLHQGWLAWRPFWQRSACWTLPTSTACRGCWGTTGPGSSTSSTSPTSCSTTCRAGAVAGTLGPASLRNIRLRVEARGWISARVCAQALDAASEWSFLTSRNRWTRPQDDDLWNVSEPLDDPEMMSLGGPRNVKRFLACPEDFRPLTSWDTAGLSNASMNLFSVLPREIVTLPDNLHRLSLYP